MSVVRKHDAAKLACPGCREPMHALELDRLPLGRNTIDICGGCHALWFDAHESAQLAPGAIVALFRDIHAHPAPVRRPLPARLPCPRCERTLVETRDLQRNTRFSYWRCLRGHGRFTPFVQFLREKNFVRPLAPAELARLVAQGTAIRCSGCGANLDLRRDSVCGYCRSPVEVLDPQATARALAQLDTAAVHRQSIDPLRLADALALPPDRAGVAFEGSAFALRGTDLIELAIDALGALFDQGGPAPGSGRSRG